MTAKIDTHHRGTCQRGVRTGMENERQQRRNIKKVQRMVESVGNRRDGENNVEREIQ